jgi:hypothetical protein
MEIFLKILTLLIPVLVGELFVRLGLDRDTDREISDAGTFQNNDVIVSAKLIAKRRQRIIASYAMSYSFVTVGVIAAMKNPKIKIVLLKGMESLEYGLLGIILGAICVGLTILFAEKVRSVNFRRENKQSYWKSLLTGPIRCMFYIYNALWLLST